MIFSQEAEDVAFSLEGGEEGIWVLHSSCKIQKASLHLHSADSGGCNYILGGLSVCDRYDMRQPSGLNPLGDFGGKSRVLSLAWLSHGLGCLGVYVQWPDLGVCEVATSK